MDENIIRLYNRKGEHVLSILMTEIGMYKYRQGVSFEDLHGEVRAILDVTRILEADFS